MDEAIDAGLFAGADQGAYRVVLNSANGTAFTVLQKAAGVDDTVDFVEDRQPVVGLHQIVEVTLDPQNVWEEPPAKVSVASKAGDVMSTLKQGSRDLAANKTVSSEDKNAQR